MRKAVMLACMILTLGAAPSGAADFGVYLKPVEKASGSFEDVVEKAVLEHQVAYFHGDVTPVSAQSERESHPAIARATSFLEPPNASNDRVS